MASNVSPTPNEWDAEAAGWDDDAAVRSYATAAFASLRSVIGTTDVALDGGVVLDFGAGTGVLTERLVEAGAVVHAVDTSTAMLEILRSKGIERRWSTVTTSTDLPDRPASFDLVVCSSVCSFLPDYPGTVVDLVRLLRPGGVFVQWDWEREEDGDHGLTRPDIRQALSAAGLTSITVETAFEVAMGDQTMQPLIGHGICP